MQSKSKLSALIEAVRKNFPQELLRLRQWVGWRYEKPKKEGGKIKKVPKNPRTGGNAMTDLPATWGTFEAMCEAAVTRDFCWDGIGFMLHDDYIGIDIDHCLNPQIGELTSSAEEICSIFDSYTEITPSGEGLHIICKGSLPNNTTGRRTKEVEVYGKTRYFTVTGNVFAHDQIAKQGVQTLVFTLEMTASDIIAKSISRFSLEALRKNSDEIFDENDLLTDTKVKWSLDYPSTGSIATMRALQEYRETSAQNVTIFDLSNIIDDSTGEKDDYSNVDTIIREVESRIENKPVVFIDYLQELHLPEDNDKKQIQTTERQKIDEICKRLRRLSVRRQVPIFLISSLSRAGYKGRIQMSALKESGGIEFISDVVIGLEYTKGMAGEPDEGLKQGLDGLYGKYREVTLRILKNRFGPIPEPVEFKYHVAYNCFDEVSGIES